MPMPRDATQLAVPDGWRVVRLRDVCDGARYGASAPARPFDPDLPRYVRITDISDAGRLRADDPRSADPERVQGYELHAGDLLFARSGSVGRTYLYQPEDGPCVFAGYLIRFRPNPEVALPRFVDLHTHSPAYHRWVQSVLHAGAQPNINAAEYGSLPILLPPLAEQRGIAAVLDAIDDAIERSEAVIAATEELRRSLLHELLSRGVPGWHSEWRDVRGLGVVPACWEVARLGEVCERPEYGAGAPARPFDASLPRYVRITDITDDGRLRPGDARSADPSEVDGYELGPGDLLFARSGATVGKTYLHRQSDGACVYAGYLIRFRALSDAALPEFLELWTRSDFYRRWVASMLRAGAQPNINAAEYSSLPVALPPLGEQEAISTALDGVDASLEESRRGTDVLRSVKASASEALLSGRVRTTKAMPA